MIDHVLGRPSVQFRKIQVLAVVSFWSFYLYRGDRHGPPFLRRLSALLSTKLTTWQTVIITLLYLYSARNFGKLVGLECPEPLANLYSRSYFRATWVTTALDAGFWSAMRIRKKGLRDFLSIVFSIYYLICAEQADEKVRKIRATLTVDHLRVSWNKGTTPYLSAVANLMRPRLMWYPPRKLRIPRPRDSVYTEPVTAWLYFNGPLSELKKRDNIVLDVPGGGFVAMDPRNHDDKLMGWAGKYGLPVLSLDYKKAPEYPYPYALNECYDVYHMLVATRGRCMGLSGEVDPKIVVSGDSAGGNLAVGMTLMVLQTGSTEHRKWQGERELPPPAGVVLIYPALDMNIGNWMSDDQMALIRERRVRKTNRPILRHKSSEYRHLAPNTPGASSDEESDDDSSSAERTVATPPTMIRLSAAHTGKDSSQLPRSDTRGDLRGTQSITNGDIVQTPGTTAPTEAHPQDPVAATLGPARPATAIKTRLAMSSMISYFNDRILTPEMMRAMIILYIGPHNRPDFSTDFLLSPLLAPEALLARFPRTWMLTGERDPLVDDTVIFAGRLRQAKRADWVTAKELGLDRARGREFHDEDWVNVDLIPGISHGFLQFVGVFPDGWKYIMRTGRWMNEAFEWAEREEEEAYERERRSGRLDGADTHAYGHERHQRARTPSDYFGSGSTAGLAEAVNGLSSSRTRYHRRTGTASSADEDRPLEMSVVKPSAKAKSPPIAKANGNDTASAGTGAKPKSSLKARGSRGRGRKTSLVGLASGDDLLERRMKGLAGGLLGEGLGDEDG